MSANGYASLDAIKKAAGRRYTNTEVQGVLLRLASITERERSEYEASILDRSGNPDPAKLADLKVRMISLCVVDGQGNRILSKEDAAELDSRFSNRLYEACVAHCNISDEPKN